MSKKKDKKSLSVPMYRPDIEDEMSEPDRIYTTDIYDSDKFWDGDTTDEEKE